jgi:hypothetical protein
MPSALKMNTSTDPGLSFQILRWLPYHERANHVPSSARLRLLQVYVAPSLSLGWQRGVIGDRFMSVTTVRGCPPTGHILSLRDSQKDDDAEESGERRLIINMSYHRPTGPTLSPPHGRTSSKKRFARSGNTFVTLSPSSSCRSGKMGYVAVFHRGDERLQMCSRNESRGQMSVIMMGV